MPEGSSTSNAPLGVFDSGVGGLSIVRQMSLLLPQEDIYFVADQIHVPYGVRSREELQDFSFTITRFLLERGAKLIVVACNTASAAALHALRARFPETPFVGMEPAVKPAANRTRTRAVGVLATPATLQGELFASVVERFAQDVTVHRVVLPGLTECVEAGDLDGARARAILQQALDPLLAQDVDTLVLACTHYPFVLPLIRELAGPGIEVVDPSPAIARQVERLLQGHGLQAKAERAGALTCYTSGPTRAFETVAAALIDEHPSVVGLHWRAGELLETANAG